MRKSWLIILSLGLAALLAGGCDGGDDPDPCEGLTLCATAGDMQCNSGGTAIQTCAANADACLVWSDTTTCGARQACDASGAEPVCTCNDTCNTEDATQCAVDTVQTCTADADGCLAWANTTDCTASNETCVNGECVGGSVCTDGETRCEANWVETCANDAWIQTTNCTPDGDTCQVDGGVAQCQGGVVCTDGETRCEANWVETCANNTWGQTTDCATDTCVIDTGVAVCEASGDCIELVYAGNIAPYDGWLAGYYSDLSTTLGDAGLLDNGQFEFYDATTGTVDLASTGVNDNYATCMQCVRVFEDNDETTGPARQYFQESGTMVIDASNDPQTGVLAMELADVTLVEVTIAEDDTYTSTPVQDGACLHITAVSLDTSIEGCNPEGATQCGGNVIQTCTDGVWEDGTDCGSQLCDVVDGTAECVDSPCTSNPCASVTDSDGVCMVIDATTYACGCNSGYSWDGTDLTCEVQTCTEIVYAGNLLEDGFDGNQAFYYADLDTALSDAGLLDYGIFEFFSGTTGTVDLGSVGVNDNYGTCDHCVVVIEDSDPDAQAIGRFYFQESGSMIIDGASDPLDGTVAFELADVTLVEVTIADDGSYTSTPVVGGECIHITAVSLDTSIDYCNTEGDTQCAGDVVRTCSGGVWVDGTDCSGSNQLCDVVNGTAQCVDAPCTSAPCASVTNSDGVCTVIDASTYACGCNDTYSWNGETMACEAGPCTSDPCDAIANSNGACTVAEDTFACGCDSGFIWNPLTALCETYTCPATVLTTAGLTGEDNCSGSAIYNAAGNGESCTGWHTNSNELVYSLEVPAGNMVTIEMIEDGFDAALWVTTDCSDFDGALCVAGGDYPEEVTFSNDTDAAVTYFVIADAYSDCGVFDLNVTMGASPCASDPCAAIDNGDGVCTVIDESTYICGCNDGFLWNDTNLTCEVFTCPATTLAVGETTGDTCNGSETYTMSESICLLGSANSWEDLYELTVGADESFTIDVAYTDDVDAVLWATTSCADFTGTSCVFGADSAFDGTESIVIDTAGVYYVVVDGYFVDDCGAYTLTVTATP